MYFVLGNSRGTICLDVLTGLQNGINMFIFLVIDVEGGRSAGQAERNLSKVCSIDGTSNRGFKIINSYQQSKKPMEELLSESPFSLKTIDNRNIFK